MSARAEAIFFSGQARLWVQLMRELRHGVKLKKVQEKEFNPLPTEFQLTPFEMLMQDIRARNYKLRKVMVSQGPVVLCSSPARSPCPAGCRSLRSPLAVLVPILVRGQSLILVRRCEQGRCVSTSLGCTGTQYVRAQRRFLRIRGPKSQLQFPFYTHGHSLLCTGAGLNISYKEVHSIPRTTHEMGPTAPFPEDTGSGSCGSHYGSLDLECRSHCWVRPTSLLRTC